MQAVFDQWMELRAAGRLEEVLPSAHAYKRIGRDGEVRGYDTCEHQIHRQVVIPGSGPNGGNGVAGLVEVYYSIRYHNGGGHNLHVHVVEAKNEVLRVVHLAHLFRCMAALRCGFTEQGIRSTANMHHNIFVHGALLGPSASSDVLMADAMLDHQYNHMDNGMFQPPIRVGCVTVHPTDGVMIKRVTADGYYSTDSLYRPFGCAKKALLMRGIDGLLGGSPMWPEWLAAYRAEYGLDRAPMDEAESKS